MNVYYFLLPRPFLFSHEGAPCLGTLSSSSQRHTFQDLYVGNTHSAHPKKLNNKYGEQKEYICKHRDKKVINRTDPDVCLSNF